MHDVVQAKGLDNAAWVVVPTILKAKDLHAFCLNIENIFRLNPFLHINNWQQVSEYEYEVDWSNHSNDDSELSFCGTLLLDQNVNELAITYSGGIKTKTWLVIEENNRGAKLTIIDDYGDTNSEQLACVDKSITAWGQACKRFLDYYRYLKLIPGANGVIERVWLPCKPMARRVIYILLVINIDRTNCFVVVYLC